MEVSVCRKLFRTNVSFGDLATTDTYVGTYASNI